MTGRGRLWRRLGATEALFQVAGADTRGDDTVNQWSVTRGSDSNLYGARANTATLTVPGTLAPTRDQSLAIRLTDYGADLLAGIVGNRPAAELAPRFLGRVAKQEVNDREDGERYTALTCNDWLTTAIMVGGTVQVNDTFPLPVLHFYIWTRANLPPAAGPGPTWPTGLWDTPRDLTTYAYIPVETVLGRYGADVAVVDFITRDGSMITTHPAAITPAATNHDPATHEPLLRRHCLSPASWSSNVNPPERIGVRFRDPDGVTTRESYSNPPAGSRVYKTTIHDRTYMTGHTASLGLMSRIIGGPLNDPSYLLETVTVDLLALLGSDVPADRRMAGQLLTAELMDYVVLSYDWPPELQGFHYLTSITETVTPESWTLTLGLLPDLHAVGMTIMADPAGTTWDTAHPAETGWDTPDTDWSA